MSIIVRPSQANDINVYSVNHHRYDCHTYICITVRFSHQDIFYWLLGLLLFCFGKSIGIALGDESIDKKENDVYTTHYFGHAAIVTVCATILLDFSADIIIICARIYLLDVCIIGWFTGLRPKYVTEAPNRRRDVDEGFCCWWCVWSNDF